MKRVVAPHSRQYYIQGPKGLLVFLVLGTDQYTLRASAWLGLAFLGYFRYLTLRYLIFKDK